VELWRGKTEGLIDPLLAFAGERIAFSVRDAEVTAIKTIDPATGELIVIDDVPDHVGAGSAARGTLLFVRGPAKQTVQIRDQYGNRIVRLDAKGSASHVAGWTSDGRAVFHDGERVMLATGDEKRRKWTVAPLPGSEPGDIPEAVGGDAVIVRHARVLWRVMLDGTRSRLADVEGRVRCSSVCVIQRAGSAEVTWAELDATTGAVGTVVYRRPLGARVPSFALSRDGALLAIADGGDHIDLRDRATGAAVEAPRGGAAWHSVAFDDSNAIWATAAEVDGHWSGLKRFEQRTGGAYLRGTTLVMDASDALRWLWEPSATGSDQTVRIAVSAEELYLEVWLATGL
jgi:hypothetical protein